MTPVQVEARKVKQGQHLRRATGEVIKVLNSNPERQSAASASASVWEICGYAEGRPTVRILGDSSALVEVVK